MKYIQLENTSSWKSVYIDVTSIIAIEPRVNGRGTLIHLDTGRYISVDDHPDSIFNRLSERSGS